MLESSTGTKCSGGEALEFLLPFARIFQPRSVLARVDFKGGFAYATDKRIAVRVQTYTIQENPSEDYPFEKLDEIVSKVDSTDSWFKIDKDKFEGLTKIFLEKVASEAEENAYENSGRYVSVDCPHCGEPVFFDLEKNILVEEMERAPFDLKIVPFYGRLKMGEKHVNIGFGYLYTACRSFDEEGLMFSVVKGQDNIDWLAMKTANGLAKAILMPLTVEDDFEPEWSIECMGV